MFDSSETEEVGSGPALDCFDWGGALRNVDCSLSAVVECPKAEVWSPTCQLARFPRIDT